jgi:hypothetical protein
VFSEHDIVLTFNDITPLLLNIFILLDRMKRHWNPLHSSQFTGFVQVAAEKYFATQTCTQFRCGCTNALSYSDNTVLMILHKYCLKRNGKIQQCFTFFNLMKIRSTFSPTVSPRMYVQTEGQSPAVLERHRSVFSQSLQSVLLPNFFTLLPRVKIYLYCQVF